MNQLIKITTIISLALTSLFINAQEQTNSLLWKVEGSEIKTSYIFGTIHMMPLDKFKMPEKVLNAIEASDVIALELDMDEPTFQTDFLKHVALPEGEEIVNFMDREEYEFLNTYFKSKMGVGLENFKNYKPLMLSSMSMIAHIGKQFASFEMEFIKKAKQKNIEIKGLETIEEQMAAIDSKSYEVQIDELIEMLNDDSISTMFDEMLAVYSSENYEKLFHFLNDYFKNDTNAVEALLFNRNTKWIPKIEEYSKEASVFYGVGAGHLGGEKGVIALLKKKGFTVTPILE